MSNSSRRGSGEGSIYRRSADGKWVGAVNLGWESGKRKRKVVYGDTKREVIAAMKGLHGKIASSSPLTPERLTVRAYLRDWQDRHLPGTVSEGTEDTYRRAIRLYIEPAMGNIRLAKLAPRDVTEMLRGMEGRGLKPETRRLARAVLRRALRVAEQEGILARNVAAIADGPKIGQVEGRTLEPAEAKALLAALEGDRLEASYVVALSLGLRRGETLGLAWSDLNLAEGRLRVNRQLRRGRNGLVLDEVKTARSRRSVHLPQRVIDQLKAQKVRQAEERLRAGSTWADTEGLVFTTAAGKPVDPDNWRHHLSRKTQAAGLGHWHPHELRHSCASLLLSMGVPLEIISETLGHSSIRVTKDRYGHLLAPARQEAADAMGAALWGDVVATANRTT